MKHLAEQGVGLGMGVVFRWCEVRQSKEAD
jgi:hypothetical protein